MGGANRSGFPSAALKRFEYDTDPDVNGFTEIFSGMGNWYGHRFENEDAATIYIQVFDAADAAEAQTQGTPLFSLKIFASGIEAKDPQAAALYNFTKGCVIRASATRNSNSAPGAQPKVQIQYQTVKGTI
jgi:hypothetical protein